MRKIKEIVRLYHEMGLSRRRIAERLQIAHSTARDVIRRANGAGLGWPIPDSMTWDDVEHLLYPGNANKPKAGPMPEWVRKLNIVMRQTHRVGETVPIVDPAPGEIEPAYVCCSVGSEQLHI